MRASSILFKSVLLMAAATVRYTAGSLCECKLDEITIDVARADPDVCPSFEASLVAIFSCVQKKCPTSGADALIIAFCEKSKVLDPDQACKAGINKARALVCDGPAVEGPAPGTSGTCSTCMGGMSLDLIPANKCSELQNSLATIEACLPKCTANTDISVEKLCKQSKIWYESLGCNDNPLPKTLCKATKNTQHEETARDQDESLSAAVIAGVAIGGTFAVSSMVGLLVMWHKKKGGGETQDDSDIIKLKHSVIDV